MLLPGQPFKVYFLHGYGAFYVETGPCLGCTLRKDCGIFDRFKETMINKSWKTPSVGSNLEVNEHSQSDISWLYWMIFEPWFGMCHVVIRIPSTIPSKYL